MPDDDFVTINWPILPRHGIGPLALGMTWDQVSALLPGGPPKPDEFPTAVYFDTCDVRIGFSAGGAVDWIDLGGAASTASFGDFDVFDASFATLTRFIGAQDPDLHQDANSDSIASKALGFVAWSNDGTTVASVAICDPAAYPESFGQPPQLED